MFEADPNIFARFDAFQSAYCALIAGAVLVQLPAHVSWVRWKGDDRNRPAILGWLVPPRLAAPAFVALGVMLVAGLAAIAAQVVPGWLPAVVAVAALWYFAQVIDVPAVRRKPNSVPLILLLLAAARLSQHPDVHVTWFCVVTIKLVIAQIYFSSAVVKWRKSGARWGDALRPVLLRYYLRNGSRLSLWLIQRPAICRLVSAAVFAFELSFWLVIPFPILTWVFVPLGIIFHLGTAVMMRIHYWIYVMPAYLVFLLG